MRMHHYKRLAAVAAPGILLLLGEGALPASAVGAQAADQTNALEEITVTAQRRQENLQNVPISVTAFTAADLETQSIRNIEDAAAESPNVVINPSSNTGSSAASIYIRGIGQFDEIITTDPGVGVYVDGVYMARTIGSLLDIGDFATLEILRGPQGTLFGKNTIGGAINITTVRPSTSELGGYGELTYGSHHEVDFRGAVGVPIVTDTLAVRASLVTINADGYGHQANGVDTGDKDRQSGRVELLWTPSSNLDVLLSGDKSRVRQRMEPRTDVYINPAAPLAFLYNVFVGPFDQRYLSPNPFFNYATGPNVDNLDSWGTSLNLSWRVADGLTARSITAYRSQSSLTKIDADNTPAQMIQFNESIDQHQLSEELQLQGLSADRRLDWTVGAIAFHEDAGQVTDSFQVAPLLPIIGDTSVHDVESIKDDSVGIYAQATYHLTSQWASTLGLRYTHESKEWIYNLGTQFTHVPFLPPGSQSDSWNPVTPKIGIQFTPTDNLLTYVSASRGFRSGGFNGRANTPGDQSFDPEWVWTYELGVKSQWLDNRLRVDGDIFYNDYRDLQLLEITTTPTGGYAIFTRNAAQAKTDGAELELVAAPVTGLELSTAIGYLDARIKSVSPEAGIPNGATLQESPKWSTDFGAQYTVPVGASASVVFRADWTHKTKMYFDAANSESIAGDFTSLNARVALDWNPGWELAAFGTNLTNKHNILGGQDTGAFGFAEVQWGAPREFGITARKQF